MSTNESHDLTLREPGCDSNSSMSMSLSLVLYILLCSFAAAAAARLTNVVLNNELIYSNERREEKKFNYISLSFSAPLAYTRLVDRHRNDQSLLLSFNPFCPHAPRSSSPLTQTKV